MKTKIAVVLIALGIVVSLGATKINKKSGSQDTVSIQSPVNTINEPIGGLVSEEH